MTDPMKLHPTSPPLDDLPGWRERRLHAAWPAVRVECVDVACRADGHHLCAVVRLGALAPADVCVGATPVAAAARLLAAEARCDDDDRLWSTGAYGDGRFVFEHVIPPGRAPGAADWVVHVRPFDPGAARPVLYPLHFDAPSRS